MLPNKLPKVILQSSLDHLQVGQVKVYEGNITLSTLSGISDIILNPEDKFVVKLTLGKDEAGYVYLKGELNGELKVTCQRCLNAMSMEIKSTFCLSPIESAATTLPSRYEPVQLQAGEIDVLDLVTEEILLNLPMIPNHPVAACEGANWLNEQQQAQSSKNEAEGRRHPFEILKKLK